VWASVTKEEILVAEDSLRFVLSCLLFPFLFLLIVKLHGLYRLRTVHFQEDPTPAEEKKSMNPRGNKLKKLDLKIQVEEQEEKCDDIASKLPKTSSYFLNSGTFEDVPAAVASTDSELIDFDYSSEDLKKMLPNFEDKGIRKWKNLANQLNLPIQIVLIAAKSKLAGVYERLAEDM
jgi:hypothetical protein